MTKEKKEVDKATTQEQLLNKIAHNYLEGQ